MSNKEYRMIPTRCSNFTMEDFDKLKNTDGSDFKLIVVQEDSSTLDIPWLCENCREDCEDRRSECNA